MSVSQTNSTDFEAAWYRQWMADSYGANEERTSKRDMHLYGARFGRQWTLQHDPKLMALVDASIRLKFIIEGGMPRPPQTADSVAQDFLAALAAYRAACEMKGSGE